MTSGHVALLAYTSKPKDKAVTYKSKWTLRLHDVQNVRGEGKLISARVLLAVAVWHFQAAVSVRVYCLAQKLTFMAQ